jgi:F-type H+-transporting ATPase subunit b
MRFDCPLSQTLSRTIAALLLLLALVAGAGPVRLSAAVQHEPAAQAPASAEAGQHEAASHEKSEAEHGSGWFAVIAKTFNFAVLVGVLVYFLREPLTGYLNSRITRVREDLVTAAETRETASRQLAEIDTKLKALPGELETLKRRGAEEIVAERERIEHAAAAERERLLEHTRREIDLRLRVARRELLEFAATLAVNVASDRIKGSMTPADQARLVDRYAAQLERAQQ